LPQMAELLGGLCDLDAIHIVAHGAAGEVRFAAGTLSISDVALYADDLTAIGAALAERGTINLWSCRTGEGVCGRAFVAALSRAAGAEVAASSRLIGASIKGGSWELDSVFAVRAHLTATGVASYAGEMGALTWAAAPGAGTFGTSISLGNI